MQSAIQRITPCLWFDTQAEEAAEFYTALFDGGVLVGGPALGAVIHFAGYPAMFATAAALVMIGPGAHHLLAYRYAFARTPLDPSLLAPFGVRHFDIEWSTSGSASYWREWVPTDIPSVGAVQPYGQNILFIREIVWKNPTTAGHTLVLTVNGIAVTRVSPTSGNADYSILQQPIGRVDSLALTTLQSGTLEIWLQ